MKNQLIFSASHINGHYCGLPLEKEIDNTVIEEHGMDELAQKAFKFRREPF